MVCTMNDADGIQSITVVDAGTGTTTAQMTLSCTPITKSLTFRFPAPTGNQTVTLSECGGRTKTFTVTPTGATTVT